MFRNKVQCNDDASSGEIITEVATVNCLGAYPSSLYSEGDARDDQARTAFGLGGRGLVLGQHKVRF